MQKQKIIALAFLIFLTSCDHPKTQDALNQIQGGLDQAKEQLAPVAENVTTMTTEQINKVVRYEYKVMSFPLNTPSADLESALSVVGQERWDCYSVVPGQNSLTIFCKRLPYAVLRSLLRFM